MISDPRLNGSAACAEVDAELWFPDRGGATKEAKRICRSCEMCAPCLEYALVNGETHGVWGGVSERDRRKMAPKPCRDCPATAPAGHTYCLACYERRRVESNRRYNARRRGAA